MWFFVVVGSIGSLILLRVILLMIKQISVSEWPYAEGKITKSEIEERPDYTTLLSRLSPAVGPNIFYSYTIGQKEYNSNRVCIVTDLHYSSVFCKFPALGITKNIVDRFPVGKKVRVYYNPKKHEYSILIKKLSNYRFIFFGMSGGCLILYSILGILNN